MANYSFLSSAKAKAQKDNIVKLNHYDATEAQSEYYTYIDNDGVTQRYSGVVSTTESGYLGRFKVNHTVGLTYHPNVEAVEGNDEYFCYTDNEGIVKRYNGAVKYDDETGTYFGINTRKKLEDKVIQIFPVTE